MKLAIISDELTDYAEALEWLERLFGPPKPPKRKPEAKPLPPQDTISERILQVLVARGMPMDLVELCEATGWRSPQIKGALGALKKHGSIVPVHGGAYKAVTR